MIETDALNSGKKGPVVLSTYDPIRQTKTIAAQTNLEPGKPAQLSFAFRHPDLFRLEIPGKSPLYLVIDKGQNPVKIEWYEGKPIKIEGSVDSQKLLAYEAFRKESGKRLLRPTYKAMSDAAKQKDQEGEIKAVEAYVHNSQLHRKELIDFIQKEIGGSIALYYTSLRWTGDDKVANLDSLVKAFGKKYPDLPMTKAMKAKVERFKKVAIGVKVADLKGQDPDGKPITLYNSLGKYTLIDFWGSWCRPCLLQIPDLKKVYADFHGKGFEIFGYAVDRSQEKWANAIKSYGMPWKHASDLKYWQSEGAKAYNVTFVPFNFLLDEKGKIIAKNLHHKTLYKKLAELFNASSHK
ncbi:MAG: TlpA family protein disulfide reductase [bacterium]|nr:TlpA family protein disulfide reductase [bacterium]